MTSKSKYRVVFGLVAVIHCVLTFVFTAWSIGWSMILLDTGYKVVPIGLEIVSAIDLLLSLPALLPLAKLALYLGFPDPVSPIYFPLPVINSLLVAFLVTSTLRWLDARRQERGKLPSS